MPTPEPSRADTGTDQSVGGAERGAVARANDDESVGGAERGAAPRRRRRRRRRRAAPVSGAARRRCADDDESVGGAERRAVARAVDVRAQPRARADARAVARADDVRADARASVAHRRAVPELPSRTRSSCGAGSCRTARAGTASPRPSPSTRGRRRPSARRAAADDVQYECVLDTYNCWDITYEYDADDSSRSVAVSTVDGDAIVVLLDGRTHYSFCIIDGAIVREPAARRPRRPRRTRPTYARDRLPERRAVERAEYVPFLRADRGPDAGVVVRSRADVRAGGARAAPAASGGYVVGRATFAGLTVADAEAYKDIFRQAVANIVGVSTESVSVDFSSSNRDYGYGYGYGDGGYGYGDDGYGYGDDGYGYGYGGYAYGDDGYGYGDDGDGYGDDGYGYGDDGAAMATEATRTRWRLRLRR
ncbi:hypothetical protein JL720_16487 [Aureococcus anophagefferens]|nr:hypothetical protein JL720_16487 [Aureococcus anophagefferens]